MEWRQFKYLKFFNVRILLGLSSSEVFDAWLSKYLMLHSILQNHKFDE